MSKMTALFIQKIFRWMIKPIQKIKRKKRQGIGKSSRAANTLEEQPSYAFKTKDPLCHAHCFEEQWWIANPCQCHCSIQGSPKNTWYQRTPWAAAYSVLKNGDIWKLLSQNGKSSHLHGRRRHSALRVVLAPPPELYGHVQMRMQLEKARNTLSALLFWNIVVCRAKIFLAVYTKTNLGVPQVQFW